MPEYLSPGVYVEEVSYRAKSIEGLGTTTTGFVGPTRYGPLDLPLGVVTSIGEFERIYGDRQQMQFDGSSPTHNYMWHAARAFFEEGGTKLYVSRVFVPLDPGDRNAYRHNGPDKGLDVNSGVGQPKSENGQENADPAHRTAKIGIVPNGSAHQRSEKVVLPKRSPPRSCHQKTTKFEAKNHQQNRRQAMEPAPPGRKPV